ncbi:hypothetical protein KIH74_17800 [Kineosporia sp. J2-2]|uniref:Membrane protein involved in the export of O-antigen and teichoic acid n=1 Tax=Kineosporia corallincola TaxID=2835133 RepID=A0ABS5TI93_9ACTN|nr:hypothetical protein [Kineosporia corallincola]MBT0770802.1 hypothetical protein [Kineosporia corallincola]
MAQVLAAGAVTGPDDVVRARARWRIADQVLSSLTVAGLSFMVAHGAGTGGFGLFGLALLAAAFTLGVTRAMVGDVFLIQFSDVVPRVRHRAAREASGAAVALGLAAGAVCCLIAPVLPGHPARMTVFAIGLALPALVVQDCLRFVFIAAGRPLPAVVLGLAAGIAQITVVALLVATDHDSTVRITVGWGLAALLTAVTGCLTAGVRPSLRQVPLWFALNRHLTVRLSVDYLLGLGAIYLAYALIGAIDGLEAIGSLWAAQMFLVPAYVMITATCSLVRPGFAARVLRGQSPLRPALVTGLALAAVTALWGAALYALPDRLGIHLTGESWQGAQEVLEPAVIGVVTVALAAGPTLGLRALGRGDLLRRVALGQTALLLGLGALGADLHGVRGAAVGLAAAHAAGSLWLWLLFVRDVLRRA